MDTNHILIVDDEKEITKAIAIYMESQGYRVHIAYNGMEALELVEKQSMDLAIIDLMMPVMDGNTLMSKIREKHEFPIIILSAKSEDMDKVMGLTMGADDYVTKPFVPMELIARVKSQLRRYNRYQQGISEAMKESGVYRVGELMLNETERVVTAEGEEIRLTPMEFKILRLLMKEPGRVFSAEEIYEAVWKEKAVNTDTIMLHIRRIREKIEITPKEPKYLKVVWGVGYKIENNN